MHGAYRQDANGLCGALGTAQCFYIAFCSKLASEVKTSIDLSCQTPTSKQALFKNDNPKCSVWIFHLMLKGFLPSWKPWVSGPRLQPAVGCSPHGADLKNSSGDGVQQAETLLLPCCKTKTGVKTSLMSRKCLFESINGRSKQRGFFFLQLAESSFLWD